MNDRIFTVVAKVQMKCFYVLLLELRSGRETGIFCFAALKTLAKQSTLPQGPGINAIRCTVNFGKLHEV